MDQRPPCFVKICQKPSEGNSPISEQPCCAIHLQSDLKKCEKAEAVVTERVAHFRKYQGPLRLVQQQLDSDLQLLDDTFQDLRDSLDRCQGELIAAITKHNDTVRDSLGTANNLREAFLVTDSMEKTLDSLESMELNSELVWMNNDKTEVRVAAIPDVNSVVRSLQMQVEMSLQLAHKLVENLNIRVEQPKEPLVPPVVTSAVQIVGTPSCLTTCNNTKGLALDDSGNIVRATPTTRNKGADIPQPAILVAVKRYVPPATVDERKVVMLSFDANEIGSLPGSFDQPIKDLHCDSERQLVFVLHDQALKVVDLCGAAQSMTSLADLEDGVQKLLCIAGDPDKLFILGQMTEAKLMLFGLSKTSREVQLKLSVTGIDKVGDRPRMSVKDRMLFVNDGETLHTVCSITGMLLASNFLIEKGKFNLNVDLINEDRKVANFIAQKVSSTYGAPYFGTPVKAPIKEDAVIQLTAERRFLAFEVSGNAIKQHVLEIKRVEIDLETEVENLEETEETETVECEHLEETGTTEFVVCENLKKKKKKKLKKRNR